MRTLTLIQGEWIISIDMKVTYLMSFFLLPFLKTEIVTKFNAI